MNRLAGSISIAAVCSVLLILTWTGCAKGLFGKPPGTFLGSCSGVMELEDGNRTRFTFSLFKVSDNDVNLYLSLPGENIRYAPVKDFSIDKKVIRVELGEPGKVYEGRIAGDSLKFRGEWGNYRGSLTLEVKE